MERFNEENFKPLCDRLAAIDANLAGILQQYGYPPMWTRENSFATLVLTILEQQVSLASAYAAFKKLKEKLELVTPQNLLMLTDEELRQCYFSRQKIVYAKALAQALLNEEISLQQFEFEEEQTIRTKLKKLKGIGDWTVDIYLIHALRRLDIFPLGDLALVNTLREVKHMPNASKEELAELSKPWQPYRSIATMLLWHYYLKKRDLTPALS